MIKYEMNKFIRTIHFNQVIIYKKYNSYYVIDNDIYIFKKIFKFKFCYKNNSKLREFNVSYVVINDNYGYDKIVKYNSSNNKYLSYYIKGKRLIMSMDMYDKIVNHLVSEYILLPSIVDCLIDSNVASRKGKGTSYGVKLYYKYRNICDSKYGKNNYYLLKLDISKFFDSINHDILKRKLRSRIKDGDALDILDTIIDSTDNGIPIGANTSQLFAIFYLESIDKFIKENLGIKCYIRYQDDMLLIHHDKEYLKYCLKEIKSRLNDLGMILNSKTKIYKNNENVNFIGVRKNKNLELEENIRKN